MITLQDEFYESLLGDKEKLVNGYNSYKFNKIKL